MKLSQDLCFRLIDFAARDVHASSLYSHIIDN